MRIPPGNTKISLLKEIFYENREDISAFLRFYALRVRL